MMMIMKKEKKIEYWLLCTTINMNMNVSLQEANTGGNIATKSHTSCKPRGVVILH